jgi:outer membrane protein OmpA-like peptidoglycan-associated protein
MLRFFQLITLLFSGFLFAQEEVVQSVYFEFDSYALDETQAKAAVNFIKNADSTRIESIQIFGYTDDVGKEAYNFKLSTNRATAIQNCLINGGITKKIIVTIEGKGRILIDDDLDEHLPEIRSKNRRVDVVLNLNPPPKIEIPGYYNTIQQKHIVGDHIYLEELLYERGSAKLSVEAKNQLDKMSKLLLKYKTLEIEIQGHVCCIPNQYKDAIDFSTRRRNLSISRAETVYKYLLFKKIPKSRMTFKGYGNAVPLGKGKEYDRRVEFVITKI